MDHSTNDQPGCLRPLARLCRDERGNLTIFGVIGFGMLMVVIGLVIDVGRVMNVHSQASSYADRVALAAAVELDGRQDALSRAMAVVRDHFSSNARLSLSGDRVVEVKRITFLSEITADPTDPLARSPIPGDVVTAFWEPASGNTEPTLDGADSLIEADRTTRFVLVETTPEREDYIFFPLLGALSQEMDTGPTVAPQALAGFKRELCNTPPVMLCSMNEAVSGEGAPFSPVRGQMIRARLRNGGSDWRPGDIGVRQSPGGSGTFALNWKFGRDDPNTTCVGDTLRLATNQPSDLDAIADGLNTRLDQYDGWMALARDSFQYRPAPNVLKGVKNKSSDCSDNKSDTSTPFPRDNCFMPDDPWPQGVGAAGGTRCIMVDGEPRAGNTSGPGDQQWDSRSYWDYNHPDDPRPPGLTSMSRHEVYRHEIANTPPGVANTPDETGAPTCTRVDHDIIAADPGDRRVIPVAIVNCQANRDKLLLRNQDIPIEAFAEVFMTEPADNSQWWGGGGGPGASKDNLYIEMIGRIRASTPESKLREYAVLYR